VFADRVELILQTANGFARASKAVKGEEVRTAVGILAEGLRYGIDSYQEPSRQLYDWLVRPIADELAQQKVRNLVVVPDGNLRLVPVAVLHDGTGFLIERFAVSSVTGMSMTNQTAPQTRDVSALVAGVSLPGGVIDKLDDAMAALIVQPAPSLAATRGLAFAGEVRAIRKLRTTAPLIPGLTAGERSANRSVELREQLSLPGVKEEVNALSDVLKGRVLLDQQFTASQFKEQAESGSYRIVHVASHGIFGGSADTSFVLAYDELLTMGNLQALLKSDQFQKHPIELLSLSACETAEGNERAPLGISGAAIKARAKSVMGTLWPVNDLAAKGMMVKTYEGIARDGLSKTEALQKAQIAMLHSPDMAHPFYWAPFVLIGNWK
jgi:CHAT domain-containing protein